MNKETFIDKTNKRLKAFEMYREATLILIGVADNQKEIDALELTLKTYDQLTNSLKSMIEIAGSGDE